MYEVSNGLYRYSRAGQITQDEAEQLLERALNLGIRFYGDADLHRQALDIAIRHNLPATYDAHYLALAERLGIEFWTADQRLFNAVRSSLSWVNLVS
jgi:predicted nucleic acid-binding protein